MNKEINNSKNSNQNYLKRVLLRHSPLYFSVLIGLCVVVVLIMASTVLVPWRADADTTATLTQNAFRFYIDNDAVQPTDIWPAGATDLNENTAITTADLPPDDNTLIRIRMSLGITGDTLAAGSQAFKLQYGEGTDCAVIAGGSWNDVGAAGSATIWRGESDTSPADGTTIASALLSTAGTLQSYEEQNNSTLNPNETTAGQSAEWDWLVQNNGALHDTTYCFRMVKSDGTALNVYTNYPKIQSEATVFDSSFEQGNGYNFTKPYSGSATKISFESERDPGPNAICTDNRKQGWFYYSISNALNQTFDITLLHATDNNNQTVAWGHDNLKPIYSYDQVTWYRVPDLPVISGVNRTYTVPSAGVKFTQDTVYFAFGFPYNYTDYLADLDVWNDSPYITVTDIGDSPQGRGIDLITLQDTNSPVPAAQKTVYWHIARQHAMEMPGNNAVDAIIRFLTGDSDEAKLMRRTSIFKFIPMMNPDGAFNGYTRTNSQGCDLNREWLDTGASIVDEATEVYLAHTAMDDWMTNGTPNTVKVFTDHHSITSMESTIYNGDSTMNGAADNPYEKLFELLDSNAHDPLGNSWSSSLGLFNVEIYDQYNPTKGSLSFTHENAAVKHFGDIYPTIQTNEAYGTAWLKTIFSVNENNAKVFGLSQVDAGSGTDPKYYVVTSPSQYTIAFNEDRGGGISYFWDRENNANMTDQQVDAERVLDDVEWNNGSVLRTNNSTNAGLTVMSNTGTHLRLLYEGLLGDAANTNYAYERSIWEDGKIWSGFTLTNNTGSPIDWADMAFDVAIENGYVARYSAAYDNTDDPPTPATDKWWGFFGTGGYKTNVFAHYVGQTGGWIYDDYTTVSDANGTRNSYTMTDGPSQPDGSSITTYLAYILRPDIDVVSNEAAVDVYRNDIANPDIPDITTGTFSSFDRQEGSLSFNTATNHLVFTYTNADTVTKKRPTYVVTGYTANTAPTLSVNDTLLDGEDGSAHSGTTHISTSYTSSVDTVSDIAYVQYLGDISANSQVRVGDTQFYTLTYNTGSNGSITGTASQNIDHGSDGTEVTAVPNTGYHFTSWSDGVLTATRTDINVADDITVTASFVINVYTLNYSAGANGSISGTTPQTVNYGANGSEITAVPSANYYFVDWSDGSTENPRTDNNIISNISVTANFAPETMISDVTAKNLNTSGATITWTTNHAATSKVEYGKTTAYGNTEIANAEVTEHEINLTGLQSNTTYHYRVVSIGNTTATSSDNTFKTQAERPSAPTIYEPINDTTIILTRPVAIGLARSANTIHIYIDGKYYGKTKATEHASGTGSFAYTPDQDLSFGWHTLYVIAENDDGILSTRSKTQQFKIEAPYVTPTILHSEVHDGLYPTISITGLAKNNSMIQVLIDGIITEELFVINHLSGTANFYHQITTDPKLSVGKHSLTLVARDENGKSSRSTDQIIFTKTEIVTMSSPEIKQVISNSVNYVVEIGDSLWKIAKSFIGFGINYNDIVWANRDTIPSLINNPGLLMPGWILFIPFLGH